MPPTSKYVMQIMWHPNDECNLRCMHCYRTGRSCQPVNRWRFQHQVITRIAELQEYYQIIRVGVLGGEPLLDPSIIHIIGELHRQGIKRIDISTNGTLVTEKLARELKATGVQLIQVSLEGPTADVNDFVRGRGSFIQATRGLHLLRNVGIETGIMMTVFKDNFPYIEAMVKFAANEGVKIVSFNRFLPVGRGKKMQLQPLKAEELQEMITLVHQLDEQYNNIDVSSDDPLLYIPANCFKGSNSNHGGCGAGIGNLAIIHDGTVYPCRRLPIAVGNIQDQSLVDILNSQRMDCFYNRQSFLKGACKTCAHQSICGGCRAAAYAFTGDYLETDPQCWKASKL